MIQRIYRILFLLFIAAGAVRLSAQTPTSEAGVWVIDSEWTNSTLGNDNFDRSGEFDEQIGYGISFNYYWTERFSTELSAQKFSADAVLRSHSVEGEVITDIGDVDVTAFTAMAQWHFNRAGRFAPYLGAGVAHLSAEYDPDHDVRIAALILGGAPPSGPYDFETEIALAGAAGVNVRITDHLYFAGELKFIPWNAMVEGTTVGDGVEVDPLLFSAGVKVRF